MGPGGKTKLLSLLRRELWEYHTALLKAPLIVSALLLFFLLVGVILGPGLMGAHFQFHADALITIFNDAPVGGGAEEEARGEWKLRFAPLCLLLPMFHGLFLLVLVLVLVHYLQGALYDDRKDRSILFWKSMPVSEWQEVLSKLSVAALIAPLIFLVIATLTQLSASALILFRAWLLDGSLAALWNEVPFSRLLVAQPAGLLAGIAQAVPLLAWLLLCSAAARTAPLMTAILLPTGLMFLERLFLGSFYLLKVVATYFPHQLFFGSTDTDGIPWPPLNHTDWLLGWTAAAAMLSAAVWLRKNRFE